MKNNKQTKKAALEGMVYNAIQNSPIPSWITTLKDGTFVDINKTGIRYIGLKREDIIGRKTVEFGIITKEQRQLFVNEIKKDGFVKNIPVMIKIDSQVIQAFMAAHKFKQGKEYLLFNFIYVIPNHKQHIESSQKDLFYKLLLLDLTFINNMLKKYNLTSRQNEITILSAAGKSNGDIAKELHISLHTVKDHLKEIFKKIGINHRSELIPTLLNLR
jgi:DNA-binding CsgD family transcriptional regulator